MTGAFVPGFDAATFAGLPSVAAFFGLGPAERIARGATVLASSPRPEVGTTPNTVIFRQRSLQLRHYAPPPGARRAAVPIVLVPSLINKAWILDLEPGRSLVAALAESGHPTYVVDWGVPTEADGGLDAAAVLVMLRRSIDRACRHAGARAAAVLGYCMGGTLAAMLAALHPERFAGLIALNAPVLFAESGRFARLVRGLDVDAAFPGEGLVPVEWMRPAFSLLDPVGSVSKHLAIERAARDPAALARVLVRERWLEENVPIPAPFARDFVRLGYQQDALVSGQWRVDGRAVRLDTIRVPTLVTSCARDFIAPPASTRPLASMVGGPVRELLLDCGHIGVVVGAEGPRRFYPEICRFVDELATGQSS